MQKEQQRPSVSITFLIYSFTAADGGPIAGELGPHPFI